MLPDSKVAGTVAGIMSSVFNLFAGFLISPAMIPDYWLFAYYLSPLHYVVEVGPTTTRLLCVANTAAITDSSYRSAYITEPTLEPSALPEFLYHMLFVIVRGVVVAAAVSRSRQ